MDSGYEILHFVASIILFLWIIPALWVSGRIILRNFLDEDRFTRLFVWLALGGFFLIPLVDLISYAGQIMSLAISPSENTNQISLFLGTTSVLFYSILSTAIAAMTYSFGIYYGRKIVTGQRIALLNDLALSSVEQNFVVLGLAGLFSAMIRGVILNFIFIRIPVLSGVPSEGFLGCFAGWIIAFIILAVVILFMDGKLSSQEA